MDDVFACGCCILVGLRLVVAEVVWYLLVWWVVLVWDCLGVFNCCLLTCCV